MAEAELRLAEVLAALSVATDLGMGHEPEKAIRACLLASELARQLGASSSERRDVYYTTLLHHLGCTATAHDLVHLFGDDLGVLRRAEGTDDTTLRGGLALLGLAGRGTGLRRPVHLARLLASGEDGGRTIQRSTCEVGARLAERLHLGEGVRRGLHDSTETWDGSSGALGHRGEEIAPAARFSLLATQAVLFERLGGTEAAVAVVRERAGHWFDPRLAERFLALGPELLAELEHVDVWAEVLAAEPAPARCIPPAGLDEVAAVFADMVDLKSPSTLGHSSGVATIAVDAAERIGVGPVETAELRRAALLHDLGRVAVPGAIWEQPRPLRAVEWEQVRLHPYHTERILSRSTALAGLAPIAGRHHERLDGSGYHRGVDVAGLPVGSRVLAVADAYQAMTQARPHRPALTPGQAVEELGELARQGGLDATCVQAVAEVAGLRSTPRAAVWPAGLSDREVEVLRLVARGASNRGVADTLVISRRTAEHHVQHIYAKIGVATRAEAALFAMEHGLVG